MAAKPPTVDREANVLRGWIDLAVGLALAAIGAIVYVATRDSVTRSVPNYLAAYLPLVVGGLTALRGVWLVLRALDVRGYKSLIAWRYLLVKDPKVTRTTKLLLILGLAVQFACVLGLFGMPTPAVYEGFLFALRVAGVFLVIVLAWGVLRHSIAASIIWLLGVALLLLSMLALKLLASGHLPLVNLDSERAITALKVINITMIFGGILFGLANFFGYLRAFLTFFTVVPIGGVWIGTAALVIVLAVMSGFETDLRDKILGSNAHLQIAREDGDFVDWHEVKAKIDRMPGVVASTPFAISEVVVAANNAGQPVIIKGIDLKTVGKVTDLVSYLKDPESLSRLDPIIRDSHDLRVPQHPRTGPVVDPPPADLPTPGEPIDFSGAALGSGEGHGSGSARGSGSTDLGGMQIESPQRYGGDAQDLFDLDAPGRAAGSDLDLQHAAPLDPLLRHLRDAGSVPARRAVPAPPVVDPPPKDLLTTDEPPADYSRPDYAPDSIIKVIDVPFDSPSLSRRTQTLPGILVGSEAVKQTHMYVGQEVRVVSPLSDPANPDATGTPIPFNRDYRVAGTFYTGMYEYDLKYVYVSLASLQEFLDRGDTVDGIEVRIENPDDTDAFVAKFEREFGPHYRVLDWKALNRSLFSALKLEKIVMFLVLGLVIMVAAFAIVGTLIMVVEGKKRQISLLKTLGASDIGVMQLFAAQGLMIGSIGTVLGVATGLVACWWGKYHGLPLNPDVYYIDKLPIHVDPMSVLAAAGAGILMTIAATIYPAVTAARIRPATGLRQ